MSDMIVWALRKEDTLQWHGHRLICECGLLRHKAADEIEALQANDKIRADEIERLQKRNALLEEVAAAAESQTRCITGARRRLYEALDTLREWSDDE